MSDFYEKNRLLIALLLATILIALGSVITVIYYNYYSEADSANVPDFLAYESDNENKDEQSTVSEFIYVDVKGAVKTPGVFKLDNGSIVNEAIYNAGGFTENAKVNNINLSMKLKDQMVIYVFETDEYEKINVCEIEVPKEDIDIESNLLEDDLYIDDSLVSGDSIIVPGESNSNQNSESEIPNENESENSELININTATLDGLMTLPGIGESKATAIINYRQNNGAFVIIEEIVNVAGIGDSTFNAIKEFITI